MILVEVVVLSLGVQVKVLERGEYGRGMTYFGINGGAKSDFPGILKKIFWDFHFNVGIRKYCYGIEDDSWPSYIVLEAAFLKWYWKKEFRRKGPQHERKI